MTMCHLSPPSTANLEFPAEECSWAGLFSFQNLLSMHQQLCLVNSPLEPCLRVFPKEPSDISIVLFQDIPEMTKQIICVTSSRSTWVMAWTNAVGRSWPRCSSLRPTGRDRQGVQLRAQGLGIGAFQLEDQLLNFFFQLVQVVLIPLGAILFLIRSGGATYRVFYGLTLIMYMNSICAQ